jgi:signal transduction histidine kinase
VSIDRIEDRIRMEIKDDGQGFAVNVTAGAQRNERLGMLGMRERVEMIGGSFSVESAPGTSTTVRVELSAGLSKAKIQRLV